MFKINLKESYDHTWNWINDLIFSANLKKKTTWMTCFIKHFLITLAASKGIFYNQRKYSFTIKENTAQWNRVAYTEYKWNFDGSLAFHTERELFNDLYDCKNHKPSSSIYPDMNDWLTQRPTHTSHTQTTDRQTYWLWLRLGLKPQTTSKHRLRPTAKHRLGTKLHSQSEHR